MLVSLFLSFIACEGNYRHVVISGTIKEQNSNAPIPYAKVMVKSWYYDTKIWQSRFVEKTTLTDTSGYYELSFDKSNAFDLATEAPGMKTFEQSANLEKSKIVLNIYLETLSPPNVKP